MYLHRGANIFVLPFNAGLHVDVVIAEATEAARAGTDGNLLVVALLQVFFLLFTLGAHVFSVNMNI
jgi:hypothetical protein